MADHSIDELYEQVRKLAPATVPDVPPVLAPVAPGIRVVALRTPTLPPAAHTNSYLVGPDRGAQLVVDPGSPYPDQQDMLDRVLQDEAEAGRPLASILLTHHHGDHVGGAAALALRWGVPILAHAATARRLAGKVVVTRELAADEVIDVAGIAVTCLHTPGHAEGHLCFEVGEATIAGDMVAGLGTILIDPSEGDMARYLASLELLLARPAKMLLPAHGPAIADGPGKLREYIAHRLMRERRVIAALEARRDASPETSIDELLPDVYSDTPRPLWPLAARSLRAHIDKLVAERAVREVGPERWQSAR